MSAAESDLRALLAEALPLLREFSVGNSMYGAFVGGDPRQFQPDPECSTDAERAAHAAACAAWERGDCVAVEGHRHGVEPVALADGRTGLALRSNGEVFGLGVQQIDDAAGDLATRIERALAVTR